MSDTPLAGGRPVTYTCSALPTAVHADGAAAAPGALGQPSTSRHATPASAGARMRRPVRVVPIVAPPPLTVRRARLDAAAWKVPVAESPPASAHRGNGLVRLDGSDDR